MRNESFQTTVVEFQDSWIDEFGTISGAHTWAEKNLQIGQRAIGTRQMTFNSELNIYRFDIRNSRANGITIECEIPARCRTVIRMNSRQIIVQEVESGEIVEKYLTFMTPEGPVWRPWHRRTYEYHVETNYPGTNFTVFMLQCNRAVKDISRHVKRDWMFDIKQRLQLVDLRGDTPKDILPLLEFLYRQIREWLTANPNPNTADYQRFYQALLEDSITRMVATRAGRPHAPRNSS